MADISIEVNKINVVSVERTTKGYLSLCELRQLKTANVLLKTDRIGAYDKVLNNIVQFIYLLKMHLSTLTT